MSRRQSFSADQDLAIAEIYLEICVPSDTLVSDSMAMRRFAGRYRERTNDKEHTQRQIGSRVVTLRKNRKLPRLQH